CLSHASATPAISPLSLHDALPIYGVVAVAIDRDLGRAVAVPMEEPEGVGERRPLGRREERAPPVERALEARGEGRAIRDVHRLLDRKSTRLNSSHVKISYAVFCLK